MSVDLSTINALFINTQDRAINADGVPCEGTDAMWDAIPDNVWGINFKNGKVYIERKDLSADQYLDPHYFDALADIPYSSSFDWTPIEQDPDLFS